VADTWKQRAVCLHDLCRSGTDTSFACSAKQRQRTPERHALACSTVFLCGVLI
jgi:hypothetical protein